MVTETDNYSVIFQKHTIFIKAFSLFIELKEIFH